MYRNQLLTDHSLLNWIGLIVIILFGGPLFNCNTSESNTSSDTNAVFTLLTASQTGVDFENKVIEKESRGTHNYDYFYNGSGVAIGDINNDQLPDLFFAGNDVPSKLYLNKGNFQFEDISATAGFKNGKWSTGAVMVDINKDGLLDIYVCNSGPYINEAYTKNELYINLGNNKFSEQAERYGIADNSRSTQASFFDMDKDGDLDLWVMNHALRNRGGLLTEWFKLSTEIPNEDYIRECSTLYRNDGNGKFTDISKAAGIQKIGFGLGLSIRDFDEDGYLDVYVANDFFIPDFLFINNGDGTFTDQNKTYYSHSPYYSMGCDAADINNDGHTDMVVVDMTPSDHVRNKTLMASMNVNAFKYLTDYKKFTPQYMFNSLFINNGSGVMSDIALFAGVSQTDWSWAPLLADFDNDGLKDLMITNGFRRDTKNNDWKNGLAEIQKIKGRNYTPKDYYDHLQKAKVAPVPNQIFKNKNGLTFEAKTEAWGFDKPSFSNGAAYADLDQDGDLDLVINNFDQPAFIYKNNTQQISNNHFIRFKLTDGRNYNDVLHSKVCIYYGDEMQCNDFAFTRGYQSYVEPVLHFGLGQAEKVDRVVFKWKKGQESVLINPAIDQVHVVNQKALKKNNVSSKMAQGLFKDASDEYFSVPFKHTENDFDDFQKEVLLPHRQSMLGPALAVGDIDGNGMEDFFVGGAMNQAGAFYLQDNDGKFNLHSSKALQDDLPYEDCGALFIDIENDGDLDLYVASGGGGEFEASPELLQDRLYLNDGKGNFARAPERHLPEMLSSTQAIAASDWDQDGDLDLFIGGRTSPGKYPSAPNSYLLKNNNGQFTDLTDQLAPELKNLGMITGVEWSDIDNDQREDLIIVGEWMPISVFKNTNNGFENATEDLRLNKTNGWYTSLQKSDIDQDGDDDFIVGNIGLNNKFHPSEEKPLYVYANDFDQNGTLDIVLSKIYQGKKVPVRGKECSTTQMPFVSEKFPTYEGFANASLEAIYEEENLENAIQYEAYTFASTYLENLGNGQFELTALPTEAQLAPVNGIITKDFDKDGQVDIVLGGNLMQTEVETPMYDSGKGLLLKRNTDGTFSTNLGKGYSGLYLNKDVKDLQLIHLGQEKRPAILVANNNSNLSLFVYTK